MAASRRARPSATTWAQIGWWLTAVIGLAFLVGPGFTYRGLSAQHIAAHLVTGPVIIILCVVQLRQPARGSLRYRLVGWALAGLGLWLIALPFVVPAEGLHIHGHGIAGLVAFAASAWSVVHAPQRSKTQGRLGEQRAALETGEASHHG